MSDASRRDKNPLLTAAGQDFPFSNLSENSLLVPVTPATPAVLRDDEERSARQEAFGPTSSPGRQRLGAPPPGAADSCTLPEIGGASKPGYFSSLLSSLPSLPLSSITGGEATTNPAPNSPPEVPQLERPPHPAAFSVPFSPVPSSQTGPTGPTGPRVPPSSAPPLQPPVAGAPASYRLSNQRRLRYAPPPDLTSSSAKQPSPAPVVPTAAVVSAPPTLLNPNVATEPPETWSRDLSGPSSQTSQRHQRNSLPYGDPSVGSSAPKGFAAARIPPALGGLPPGSGSGTCPADFFKPADTAASVGDSESTRQAFGCFQPVDRQTTTVTTCGAADLAGTGELPRETSSSLVFEVNRSTSQGNPPPSCVGAPFGLGAVVRSSPSPAKPLQETAVEDKFTDDLAEVDLTQTEPASPPAEEFNTGPTGLEGASLTVDIFANLVTKATKNEGAPAENLLEPSRDKSSAKSPGDYIGKPTGSSELSNYFGPAAQDSTGSTFYDPKSEEHQLQAPATSLHQNAKSQQESIPPLTSFQSPLQAQSPFLQQQPPPLSSHYQSQPRQQSAQFPRTLATSSASSPSLVPSLRELSGRSYPSQTAVPQVPQSLWEPSQGQAATPTFYDPSKFSAGLSEVFYPHSGFPQGVSGGGNRPFVQTTPGIASSLGQGFPSGPKFSSGISSSSNLMAAMIPESTGTATLSPVQMSVNPLMGRSSPDIVPPNLQNLASGPSDRRTQYRPVYHHWFYRKEVENKSLWQPFSMNDSMNLETVHNSTDITPETKVATDGGRYDVDVLRRQRIPVYWTGQPQDVRRCSWFSKGLSESRYVPYEENVAARLEEEYRLGCLSNNWNRKVDLANGEYITFHGAGVQMHYLNPATPELASSWGNGTSTTGKPRVVRRGVSEFNIEEGEPEKVDHLLFLVHGIGSVCDLKFRTVEEVVDEFRSISLQLVQSHYRTASERKAVNRIEVLPISWHATLHSEDTGIDNKLKAITLESIPKLRHFTNDTLLDILFYTSPVYCQTIVNTVGGEMNRLYSLFKERNSDFEGGVYLGGHSLGSLILFDLLCHQKPPKEDPVYETVEGDGTVEKVEGENGSSLKPSRPALKRRLSKKISYVMGGAGTGQPFISYPQLSFYPKAFFALGSPIGMFVTVRGIDNLGEDFALPTCPAFFNIFHPFDPVAYRIESLINTEAHKYRPMLIPHHKGRKRMHLELKETMARVGADLKQKLLDSVRSTWNSVYQLAMFHRPDNQALELEIDKVVEEQLQKAPSELDQLVVDDGGADLNVGKLNGGRRVDYVLQEAPFEYINEYIFALTSHVCYWESEDTMLMMLKEIYGSTGIQTDAQLPQQTMTIERVSPSTSLSGASLPSPAEPGTSDPPADIPTTEAAPPPLPGPPPTSGFVRKS
ncbi:SEC23-interacting protein [Orussus abietinus]|uniref:SEC23-interacting protein n=1 Tax=Orussus abietinus TaxID=222816 RepID=UPI000625095E|nr:SEC23-interacting protein [Orussus abietinus]